MYGIVALSSAGAVGAIGAAGGCARGDASSVADAPPRPIDAADIDAPPPIDAPDVDAPTAVDAGIDAPGIPGASPLLLSEVVLQPTNGEFIEIVNTSNTAVDLSNYYLSDNGAYWKLPSAVPTVDGGDFLVHFPAGASIAGHGVVLVALDTAANFKTTYPAATADYSVADHAGGFALLASSGTPSLTNGGELVVLFEWDGQSDLVTDVDMVIAGAATPANALVTKGGIAQDGPDLGATKSTYLPDANTLAIQATAPTLGKSTKRIALEAGHETQTGAGNGQAGDDETSEVTSLTWDTAYTTPTPGTVPAALLP
jgi:hypothetical protein